MIDGYYYAVVSASFQAPEILGELSMRKQCVPGSAFLPRNEPGHEANNIHMYYYLPCDGEHSQIHLRTIFSLTSSMYMSSRYQATSLLPRGLSRTRLITCNYSQNVMTSIRPHIST